MKTRSKLDPKVFYEHWKTPLDKDYPNRHYLASILHGTNQIYFFLGVAEKPFKKFHVMTLPCRTPFRVYPEQAFVVGLGKNMNPRSGRQKWIPKPGWKFWNTPFVEEFDKGDHPLSLLCRNGKGLNVCHYTIGTSDESVEFLDTRDPSPRWEYYNNITLKALLHQYATIRLHQSHQDWSVKNGKMVLI